MFHSKHFILSQYFRWNFSVARHNVKLIPDPAALCHGNKQLTPLKFDVRVIVPDGLVCGISLSDPKTVIWQHKVIEGNIIFKGLCCSNLKSKI